MKSQELMNMAKMNLIDISSAQEYKKYLEKKTLLLKKIEAIKQTRAKIKLMKLQTLKSNNYSLSMPNNVQNLSPLEVNNVPADSSNEVQNTTLNNLQKLSPVDNQTKAINTTTNINKPSDIAAISPISPSDLPCANINSLNANNNVNYIPENQKLPVFTSMEQTKSSQLTVENFSSFMNFYNCINSKFSTVPESIIKSTEHYKVLQYAITLACSKRVNDALKLLYHITNSTMDICKEILSLALKGHRRTALIYIYLLTPKEIQYYNTNLKAPNLKTLTSNDVLSVVSILLNCVQRKSNQNNEIKNDLLPNLGSQSQVNVSTTQNVLLTFINNINCSLSHN